MTYPEWFNYKVAHFSVHYDDADNTINEILIKKGIDARDVISMINIIATPYVRVWYRERISDDEKES